jgi:hypothetical protein
VLPTFRTAPPSVEPAPPAAPLRIVKWLSVTVLPVGTCKPRYFDPPSMMFVRALVPTIVMSESATMSLLMLIVPAGTLIVSVGRLAFAAVIAVRRLTQVCAVTLQAGVVASLDPLVTVHVSAWAGAATASDASTARRAVRTRIFKRH